MKLTISRKLSLSFAAALIFTLIIGTVSYFSISTLRDTAGWVDHTHEVLGELLQIESSLKNAETGQRGFLLTGEERYLEPYLAARTKVDTAIQNVRRLTSDNPHQYEFFSYHRMQSDLTPRPPSLRGKGEYLPSPRRRGAGGEVLGSAK